MVALVGSHQTFDAASLVENAIARALAGTVNQCGSEWAGRRGASIRGGIVDQGREALKAGRPVGAFEASRNTRRTAGLVFVEGNTAGGAPTTKLLRTKLVALATAVDSHGIGPTRCEAFSFIEAEEEALDAPGAEGSCLARLALRQAGRALEPVSVNPIHTFEA